MNSYRSIAVVLVLAVVSFSGPVVAYADTSGFTGSYTTTGSLSPDSSSYGVDTSSLSPGSTVSGSQTNTGLDSSGLMSGSQTNTGSNSGTTLINPLSAGSLPEFLTSILKFVVKIGVIVVILMLVFVGYKFVVAQGVPGKIEEARRMLLWTVVGALILLGAQVIAAGIQTTVTALTTGN